MVGYNKATFSKGFGNPSCLNLVKIYGRIPQQILSQISEATKGTEVRISGTRQRDSKVVCFQVYGIREVRTPPNLN